MSRRRLLPLLVGIALILPTLAAATNARVATILIHGLDRIGRERLLTDLRLGEGDVYRPGLDRELELRGRRLPYLSKLRVESRSGETGVHLTLRVREARRLNFSPTVIVLDDGDIDGGLQLESASPLGLGESVRGTLLVGNYALGRLALQGLPLLPGLSLDAELAVSDYEDPFVDGDLSRRWGLIGPAFALPAGGRMSLLSGWERLNSDPARGRDPDGSEAHVLTRLALRQPLPGEALASAIALEAELRSPSAERGYGLGTLALETSRTQGRWLFEARLVGGLASHASPRTDIHHMAAWRHLRAYEPGDFPAREFQFARLRADLTLFHLPIRLRRGAAPELAALGPYFLLDGARFREYRAQDFADAGDWGLGVSMVLPTRLPLRASLGLQWDELGESSTLFILEER